jgi:FixJ family two-component response regulator
VTIQRSSVAIIDDDESVREALPALLQALGFAAYAFRSAEEFLASDCIPRSECLILDITMPGMSGPDLHRELQRRQVNIPVIFITAKRDEKVRTQLMARGAVECLFKPVSDSALLDALRTALAGC